MAKPIIDKIVAFDSTNDYTVTYSCNGMQPSYDEVFIYDTDNLVTPVYHKLSASMNYKHTIKAESISIIGTITPTIDIEVFGSYVGYTEGEYHFKYDGTNTVWILYDDGSWVNVDVTDYGITIDEPVSNNDNFTVTYCPPSGLENGKQYKIVIKCYGYDMSPESALSDPVWFYCFTDPFLSFEGIDPDIINSVSSSSLGVTLQYYQPEGERIQSFQFKLLDSEKNEIKSSPIYSSLETNGSYVYTMLDDSTSYWIKAIATTEYDTEVSISVHIYVKYNVPIAHSIVKAEVEEGTGIVTYSTDIRVVSPERDDYVYIQNKYIDLRNDEITYKKGFIIEDDYTFIIRLQEGITGEIARILQDTHITKLECIDVGDNLHCRYKLTVYDVEGFECVIYSLEQPLYPFSLENSFITIWIQRKNNLYDLIISREDGGAEE